MRFVDYDIVMLALPRWDGPYSSTAYSLSKALSKHTRVFYIDNPFTVKEFLFKRHTAQVALRKSALLHGSDIFFSPDKNFPNLVSVTPRLTLPINWLPPGIVYDSLSRLNDIVVARSINATLKKYNITKYVLINSFNPFVGRFMNFSVDPLLKIYQTVDDIGQSLYVNKHGPRLEEEAIKTADFTIVTSSELKRLKSLHSSNVFLIPNAANTSLFRTAATEQFIAPREIQQLPFGKKIICYIGNICHRIDYELLVKTAKHHHDKILLMVGPISHDNCKTSGLHELSNVVFAGSKRLEELPAYLHYSDCCVIPFLCNQLTKSIYPLKINEYLSAGKPVVTTNFSQDIMAFDRVATISASHDDFITNIDKAISTDSPDLVSQRISFSAGNTWEARARHFIDITVEFLEQNDRRGRKSKRRTRIQNALEGWI